MAQQSGDIDLRAKDRFETNRRFDEMELPRPDRPPVVVVPSIPASDSLAAADGASEGVQARGSGASPTLPSGPSTGLAQLLRWGLFALVPLIVTAIAVVIGLQALRSVETHTVDPELPVPVIAADSPTVDDELLVEDTSIEDTLVEEAAVEEAVVEAAAVEEIVPGGVIPQDVVPQDVVPAEEVLAEDLPPVEAPLAEDAASEEVAYASFETALANVDVSEIVFLPGTGELTDMGGRAIDDLAQVLLLDPGRPVEITVSTFSETTPGQNHGLSVAQAATITGRLIEAGVDLERLRGVGLGSSGSQRPELAGAILFGSNDLGLRGQLAQHGPLTLTDTPVALGPTFTERQQDHLLGVAGVAANDSDSTFDIVAYAWTESSPDANHELSHAFADSAVAVLTSAGIAAERLATVGLGERSISVGRLASVVRVHSDESAAMSVALSQIELDAVTFEPSSAILTEVAERVLDEIVELTSLDPVVHFEVASHTYSQATSQANHDLSEQQSRAVRDYLVSHGVDPHRLESVAHGDPAHFGLPGRATVTTFTVVR